MKRNLLSASALSLLTAVLLATTGCGGGSNNNTSSGGGSSAVPVSGTAIDGILKGSTVCIDTNGDGDCSDEAASDKTTTDFDGKFTLTTASKGPLLVSGGVDLGTGEDFTGSLKAPEGSTVITPLTSAVQALVEDGKTKEQAEFSIKAAFGINQSVKLTELNPLEVIADTNSSASEKAKVKKVLAAQAQLQTIVHAASTAIAGAGSDGNTTKSIAHVMGKVFSVIAKKTFAGATSDVNITSASVSAVIGAVANDVYKNNLAAKVAVKSVADSAAQAAVQTADITKQSIQNATAANATASFNVAIVLANTTLQNTIQAKAVAAAAKAKTLSKDNADLLQKIAAAQAIREEQEAKIAAAKTAETDALDAKEAAKKAAEANAQNQAKYTAYLTAVLKAEQQAAKAEAAQADAAIAAAKAAQEEANIAEDVNASKAAATKAQTDAEEIATAQQAQATLVEDAAKKAVTVSETATSIGAAKAAVKNEKKITATKIKDAKTKTEDLLKAQAAAQAKAQAKAQAAAKAKAQAAIPAAQAKAQAAAQAKVAFAKKVAEIQILLNTAISQEARAKADAAAAQTIAEKNANANTAASIAQASATAATANLATLQTIVDNLSSATVDTIDATYTSAKAAATSITSAETTASAKLHVAQNASAPTTGGDTTASTTVDITKLKKDVNTLIDSPETGATVADAKNMFTQLRETAMTFINTDEATGDLNVSSLVGSQGKVLKDNIEPAVKKIVSDLNATGSALQTSLQSFSDDLNASFDGVITSINHRFSALNQIIDANSSTANWGPFTTSSGDKISHTYTIATDTNESTGTFTINNQTLTIVNQKGTNSDELKSLSANGAIAFSGTGYDLNVTTLSFDGTKASLSANGTLTGKDNAKMELTTLTIELDASTHTNREASIKNPSIDFNGTISTNGRSLNGTLSLRETGATLTGSYTGAKDEPSFQGKVSLNSSFNAFMDDLENHAFDKSDGALTMVTLHDGSKHLVYGIHPGTQNGSFEDNTTAKVETNISYLSLKYIGQSSSTSVECKTTQTQSYSNDNGHKEYRSNTGEVSCADENNNSVTVEVLYPRGNQIIATIDGVDHVVQCVDYYGYYNEDSRLFDIDFVNGDMLWIGSNGETKLDGQVVNLSNIRTGNPVKNVMDRNLNFLAEGTLTHGNKKLTASFGLDQVDTQTRIVAQNLELTDGTSFVKVGELSAKVLKTTFIKKIIPSDNNQHFYPKNPFYQLESYTYTFNNRKNNNHADEFDPTNDLEDAKLSGLELSITDKSKKVLSLKADFSLTNVGGKISSTFDGEYTYRTAKFVGHIDTSNVKLVETPKSHQCGPNPDDMCTDNDTELYDIVSVFGSVEANGFMPFTITATADRKLNADGNETVDVYGLFTRNSSYKLGIRAQYLKSETTSVTTKKTLVELGDTYGVLGNLKNTNTYTDATGKEADTDPSLYIKDSAGTSLAKYGKDATGNSMEIIYSDKTVETLF